jgi:hypothetical protein
MSKYKKEIHHSANKIDWSRLNLRGEKIVGSIEEQKIILKRISIYILNIYVYILYLYEERMSRDAPRNPSVSLDFLYGGRGERSGLSGYHRW